MFNNKRVLHGRRAFAVTEPRVLEGGYVGIEELRSRLRILAVRYGLIPDIS